MAVGRSFRGVEPVFITTDEGVTKRDKSLNTPQFNKKAASRRAKAKMAAKSRKFNQKK